MLRALALAVPVRRFSGRGQLQPLEDARQVSLDGMGTEIQKATAKAGIPELLKRLAPLGLAARARRVWHRLSHKARLLCAALLMTASSFGLSMVVAFLGAL
ncbi:hypothetical protein [Variovorax sp. LjRoot178]|uniref:hypothetical protein n=1 Tax=Variovorax sp. LjRoot178 TaxID=3342277 RepID=UPI003F50FBA5